MPVELHGQGGLQADFTFVGPMVQAKVHADIAQGLQVMYQKAFELAPVDTGFLRGSMSATILPNGEGRMWAPARYAGFQEYGTRRNRAQPFMRPALRDGINFFQSQGYRQV